MINRLEEENKKMRVELDKEQCKSTNLKEIIEKQTRGKEFEVTGTSSSNEQTIIKQVGILILQIIFF